MMMELLQYGEPALLKPRKATCLDRVGCANAARIMVFVEPRWRCAGAGRNDRGECVVTGRSRSKTRCQLPAVFVCAGKMLRDTHKEISVCFSKADTKRHD